MNSANGVLCLTFDDSHFDHWIEAAPLFERYGARGTFFCSGKVTPHIAASMKELVSRGHSVGLHTLHHADAPEYFASNGAERYIQDEILPQLCVCRVHGLDVRNFAYPNNKRTDETDAALSCFFRRFRAGAGPRPDGVCPAAFDPYFQPVSGLAGTKVMRGIGIGEYYHTKPEEIEAVLRRAAAKNEAVTFFSHDIAPGAGHIHMPVEMLAFILRLAASLNMAVPGFDSLA